MRPQTLGKFGPLLVHVHLDLGRHFEVRHKVAEDLNDLGDRTGESGTVLRIGIAEFPVPEPRRSRSCTAAARTRRIGSSGRRSSSTARGGIRREYHADACPERHPALGPVKPRPRNGILLSLRVETSAAQCDAPRARSRKSAATRRVRGRPGLDSSFSAIRSAQLFQDLLLLVAPDQVAEVLAGVAKLAGLNTFVDVVAQRLRKGEARGVRLMDPIMWQYQQLSTPRGSRRDRRSDGFGVFLVGELDLVTGIAHCIGELHLDSSGGKPIEHFVSEYIV